MDVLDSWYYVSILDFWDQGQEDLKDIAECGQDYRSNDAEITQVFVSTSIVSVSFHLAE